MPIKTHQAPNDGNRGTVLVLGATGKQGGAVANALKLRGWSVRALVRNPESEAARALALGGIEVLRGDLLDAARVRAAMEGAHGVFSMQPNSGSAGSGVTNADEVQIGKSVANAAFEAGVKHLVYTSAGIISRGRTGLDNLDCKIDIEDHIRRLGIASTIIRPATFMDLFALPGMGLDQGMFSFFMHPDQAIQVIAVEDIGKIAATILGDSDRFQGRTIEIAGDEVTGFDLQRILSEAAGRPILYHRFSDALLESNEFLGRNAKLFNEGRASGIADISAVKREFGDLLSLEEWLAGTGKPLFQSSLKAHAQPVARR